MDIAKNEADRGLRQLLKFVGVLKHRCVCRRGPKKT